MWCLAFSAAVATLWLKLFLEIPGLMFLKDVLRGFQRKPEPYAGAFARAVEESRPPTSGQSASTRGFDLGFDLVTLRALSTNFDIGLLLLVAATTADQFLGPVDLPGLGAHSFRALWLAYYGLVLPLDFLDYLVTYLRRGHFGGEMERLVALAHHFRSQIPARERESSEA
jgi:hypothetical protein